MHAIQILLNRPEVEQLGWVLLHFFWQGTLIAALCAIAFATLRRATSHRRYLIACGAADDGRLPTGDMVCCCWSSRKLEGVARRPGGRGFRLSRSR